MSDSDCLKPLSESLSIYISNSA